MLKITASLADGIPVDLRDAITSLDDRNIKFLITPSAAHPECPIEQQIFMTDEERLPVVDQTFSPGALFEAGELFLKLASWPPHLTVRLRAGDCRPGEWPASAHRSTVGFCEPGYRYHRGYRCRRGRYRRDRLMDCRKKSQ